MAEAQVETFGALQPQGGASALAKEPEALTNLVNTIGKFLGEEVMGMVKYKVVNGAVVVTFKTTVFDEDEMREIREIAKENGYTVSFWWVLVENTTRFEVNIVLHEVN